MVRVDSLIPLRAYSHAVLARYFNRKLIARALCTHASFAVSGKELCPAHTIRYPHVVRAHAYCTCAHTILTIEIRYLMCAHLFIRPVHYAVEEVVTQIMDIRASSCTFLVKPLNTEKFR